METVTPASSKSFEHKEEEEVIKPAKPPRPPPPKIVHPKPPGAPEVSPIISRKKADASPPKIVHPKPPNTPPRSSSPVTSKRENAHHKPQVISSLVRKKEDHLDGPKGPRVCNSFTTDDLDLSFSSKSRVNVYCIG
jgi:hypothetical protein